MESKRSSIIRINAARINLRTSENSLSIPFMSLFTGKKSTSQSTYSIAKSKQRCTAIIIDVSPSGQDDSHNLVTWGGLLRDFSSEGILELTTFLAIYLAA